MSVVVSSVIVGLGIVSTGSGLSHAVVSGGCVTMCVWPGKGVGCAPGLVNGCVHRPEIYTVHWEMRRLLYQ